jgi:hypothetical protein
MCSLIQLHNDARAKKTDDLHVKVNPGTDLSSALHLFFHRFYQPDFNRY